LTAADLKYIPATKKQAIGHGKSPSSSIITAYSSRTCTRVEDANQTSPNPNSEIGGPKATKKRLFEPNSDSLLAAQEPTPPIKQEAPPPYRIVLQPETRPISQEQLVAEVKGIYAGLVMVEGKCIQVANMKLFTIHNGFATYS
jgi:hypothetical protein